MFKSTKIAGFFLFFTIMGSATIFAQTPQLPPQQAQQTEPIEVSDEELNQFAEAFMGIQTISQRAQTEVMAVIEKEGMEIPRFNEIFEASQNPEMEVEATPEEKQKHQKIVSEMEKMQVAFQAEMETAIADAGLSIEKYEKILMGIQQDPSLQQRLQATFQQQ